MPGTRRPAGRGGRGRPLRRRRWVEPDDGGGRGRSLPARVLLAPAHGLSRLLRRDGGDGTGGAGRPGSVSATSRRRFARRARARRFASVRPLLAVVVLAALLVGGVWAALASPLLEVRTVTVRGAGPVLDASTVRRAAAVGEGSLLRVDTGGIRRRVSALPAVARVVVHRSWPHGIVLQVTERRPAAVVRRGRSLQVVDAGGVAFREVPAPVAGLPVVDVAAAAGVRSSRSALAVLAALPEPLRARVSNLAVSAGGSVSFRLRGGARVVWGEASDGAWKASVLQLLLARKASVYDVSAPDAPTTR